MITGQFAAIDLGKIAAKAGLLSVWLAAESIFGVLCSAAALGYATQHVHDPVKTKTANNIVQIGYHSFDHSTAGVMAIAALCALGWLIATVLLTIALISAWEEFID